ncbi:MAG: biotin--[acetyl-CoA-carboxylase] ligase, partial [Clostridia bacterium]|nr:biotin--[acetyl-CoA-carboxylase] ligase [Clostridia bacterium]
CGGFFSLDNLFVLKTINSTNSYCKALAKEGATHETVVIADKQTEGRGRLGREFFSPEGTGLYMSIILKPSEIPLSASLLTIAAGIAVCRTLETSCKSSPLIKWVNDIFINNKKVCGILAESVINATTNQLEYIIVGIGLNVSTPAEIFPGKLKDIAASAFPDVSRNEIAAKIINEFHNIYTSKAITDLIDEYKSYSLVLGKRISFTKDDKTYLGTATELNIDGNLVVTL